MPADPWNELARLTACWLLVLAAAAPVGLSGWLLARKHDQPILPPIRGWRVPWSGVDVFFAFLAFVAGLSLFSSATVSVLEAFGALDAMYGPKDGPRSESNQLLIQMWGYVVAVPLLVAIAIIIKSIRYPTAPSVQLPFSSRVALSVVAWVGISLVTLTIHSTVLAVFSALGWPIEEHPLAHSESYRTLLDRALLVVQVCIAAPLIEEVMFRGILLPWLLVRRANVWPVFGASVLIGAGPAIADHGWEGLLRGPTIFAVGLAAGWFALSSALHRKRLTLGAIYASAAIFAVVHSKVWPNPIPLFVLGLGLGWLIVRTRGLFAPIAVHALFNAVAAILVLRGT